jgi:flagellar basal-body rod modification protein FlgD
MPISTIGAQIGQSSQTDRATASLADNFDTFLLLLTTQLRNQDPLEPLSSNEFTAQLVQFAGVEQSITTNKNLEALIALNWAAMSGSAIGYLGQNVTLSSDKAALSNGSAEWSYTLGGAAKTVTLTVTDETGRIVYAGEGAKEAGQHKFAWDGRDNGGVMLPDGKYTLTVTARDTSDEAIKTTVRTGGLVSAVDFSGNEPMLTVNGIAVPLNKVLSVSRSD